MSGNKIHRYIENPIDLQLIKLCEIVSNVLRKDKCITPNMITTVGLMMGLISIYFIMKDMYILGFIFFWICYWFDCLDGYYARKYNMTSEFGDYYDHFRDIVINGLVIIIIYSKIKDENIRRLYLFSVIVFGFLLCCHFGCQEKNSFNKSNNGCLEIFTQLCYDKENIHNTKHFGNGTFILIISIFILLLKIKN